MPEQTGYAIVGRVKDYLIAQAKEGKIPEPYIRSVADAFMIVGAASTLAYHEQNFNRVIESFKQVLV
jgi:regulator of RNase E activity RraA